MFYKLYVCALLVGTVQGYSTGAPEEACESMDPSAGHGGKPQTGNMPYLMTIDTRKVDSNGHVFFTIRAREPNTFTGFMVQAIGEREGKPVGQFTIMEDVKLIECFGTPDNTATHVNNEPKEEVVVRWVPDNDYSGKVVFHATVVKTRKEYWVRRPAKPLIVQRAKA